MTKRYTIILQNSAGPIDSFLACVNPGESLTDRLIFWLNSEHVELESGDAIIIELESESV